MLRLLGMLSLLSAAAIWGGVYVVSKYVLDYIPPMALVAVRLVIAAAVLGLLLAARGGTPVRRGDWPLLAATGFVAFTISVSAQFAGTKLSSAHNGALITSASPAFIVLFGAWLLRERVTGRQLLALALASAGVLVVVGPGSRGEAGENIFAGNLYLVAAAGSWALYTVMAKMATRKYPTLLVATYTSLFGALLTAPLAARDLLAVPWASLPALVWWGIAYVGLISTALALFLWNKGFELVETGTAALFFFAQPVVGALLGWLLLGEQLSPGFFLGGLLILAGVGLSSRRPA